MFTQIYTKIQPKLEMQKTSSFSWCQRYSFFSHEVILKLRSLFNVKLKYFPACARLSTQFSAAQAGIDLIFDVLWGNSAPPAQARLSLLTLMPDICTK
jgi:hypothetical protein